MLQNGESAGEQTYLCLDCNVKCRLLHIQELIWMRLCCWSVYHETEIWSTWHNFEMKCIKVHMIQGWDVCRDNSFLQSATEEDTLILVCSTCDTDWRNQLPLAEMKTNLTSLINTEEMRIIEYLFLSPWLCSA